MRFKDLPTKAPLAALLFAIATVAFAANLHAQVPVITSEPQDRTVYVGYSYASLSVVASGQNVKYHWFRGNPETPAT
jgi:hypothetical protein